MPSDPSKPSQLSCTSCRHRKVKCDKTKPCSACRRSNVECIFPNRPFKPRGRQGGSKARNAEITQRLQRLEGLVGKLGGENAAGALIGGTSVLPSIEPAIHRQESFKERQGSSSESPRSQEIEPISKPDGSRYLGNDFWSSLSGEVDGLKQLLDAPSEDEEEEWDHVSSQSPSTTPFPDTLFIFGGKSAATDLRSLHPFAHGIALLCNMYFQNVDPLFKILHRPTVQVAVSAAADNLNAGPLDPAQEALMFSIYFAAITSMTQEQCLGQLGQDRDKLLAQFKYGAETALANAHFLSSTELKSLVAFVIYVACLRTHTETRTGWALVGLAIRIAYSLDLNSEAAVSAFPPFEAELRRRLWFALCVLDVRSSEDRGTSPMIIKHTFDTRMAANINDADLDPLSISDINDRLGCTEMTFCLVTHEASAFARRHVSPNSVAPIGISQSNDAESTLEQKKARTREFREHLESKYLVYCDESVPIFWVAKRVAMLIGLKMELLLQYPLQPNAATSSSERDKEGSLERATEILDMANEAESSDVPTNFRWFIKTYPQWHPLAVALAELCSQLEGPTVDRAWAVVDVVFDKLGNRIADTKKGSLWRPIKALHTRAKTARAHYLKRQQNNLPPMSTNFNDLSSLNLSDSLADPNIPAFKQEDLSFDFSAPPDMPPNISLNQNEDPINWEGWEEFLQNANNWDGPQSAGPSSGVHWPSELGINGMFP